MTTIPINITVQSDGIAIVHLPTDLPPGEYDGTVTVSTEGLEELRGWNPGFWTDVVGGWSGEPPERPEAGYFEVRQTF